MASRETPLRKNEGQSNDTGMLNSYRGLEEMKGRFVNDDEYERRITRSPSNSGGQRKGSSRTELGGSPYPSTQLGGTHEDNNIDTPPDSIMRVPLDGNKDHDSGLGLRNDPVRLSRKAAVKRNGTKERKTRTEGQDSTVQGTQVCAKTLLKTPAIRSTTEIPSISRRFSFDQSPDKLSFNLAELSDTLNFEHVHLTPVAGPKRRHIAQPTLDTHQQAQGSVESHQPRLSCQAQRSYRATGGEYKRDADAHRMTSERRRVPTTFDEILGERKKPTALL
jgi:hypothetical protein